MKYSHAFECSDCPETNSSKGCPAWVEFMVRDAGASQDRLQKMCGLQAWPRFMTEVIAASNRPAAAIESFRNEAVESIRNHSLAMAMHLSQGFEGIKAIAPKEQE